MQKEIRQQKIASVLHRALSRISLQDKILNKNIVISHVKLSKDLKIAYIYVLLSALLCNTMTQDNEIQNKSLDITNVVNNLNDYSYSIRREIFDYVEMRFIPKFIFKSDVQFNALLHFM
ncbi:ribosome-binding factor A [Wolbachia endosymbiont of Howardula sp.]|uniref:ribosome-binding factor A n=1 Tax=Wolbachia endosymbiont of Howardula sp. TaxID=2916816 RepID=UPI00217D953C|nr:ribosome-binding factor A [Wolbachia endosymbiont of Howardula sp.]UWI82960.1 ribosome-binding factor A [Wolbachia endosymbiont of Howardula sp.]